ncbi:hypothetical protein FOYG_14992 [Fusarium oxysporum NRRL 32931]|uniref:Uncharacterized protein n=1 Tax=Fusarium oxysporum NRRL 32931 TaxID=660029 RepID=W9HK25_FUSOX|nr:hypothetical protein FOYG_14992 [Fusarium oxysporum NRRL 32931]
MLSDADEVEDSTATGIVPNRGGQEEVVTANQCADENEDKDADETRPAKRAQPCECIRPSVVPRGLGFGWPGLTDERV